MGTTAKGYPYPEGTDFVVDGDDAIQALAQAVDAKLPFSTATGTATVVNIPGNTSKSVTVTFPSGRFTSAPAVTATSRTTSAWLRGIVTVSNLTKTSFQFTGYNNGSTSASSIIGIWMAIQQDAEALLTLVVDVEPTSTVTCLTDGCSNADIPIAIPTTWFDDDGATHPVDAVECGVCGADITATEEAS